MISNELESKVKNLAKKKGILLSTLCENIGLTQNGLNFSLKNNTLKVETLEKIANVLEVPIGYFFGDVENENSIKIDTTKLEERIKELEEKTEYQKLIIGILKANIQRFNILEDKDVLSIIKKQNKEFQKIFAQTQFFLSFPFTECSESELKTLLELEAITENFYNLVLKSKEIVDSGRNLDFNFTDKSK